MGGARETVVDSVKGIERVGNVRIHESGGQVHFHDDKNGLKVAVPAHEFWDAWNSLLGDGKRTFIDPDKSTVLYLTNKLGGSPNKPRISTILEIRKLEMDPSFEKLHKFVTSR